MFRDPLNVMLMTIIIMIIIIILVITLMVWSAAQDMVSFSPSHLYAVLYFVPSGPTPVKIKRFQIKESFELYFCWSFALIYFVPGSVIVANTIFWPARLHRKRCKQTLSEIVPRWDFRSESYQNCIKFVSEFYPSCIRIVSSLSGIVQGRTGKGRGG